MKVWKVGVAYERYGYLTVLTDDNGTEDEAFRKAQAQLRGMNFDELEQITRPLENSEECDREAVWIDNTQKGE